MNKPEISIILPAYNAGAYISRIIDEILSQQFSNFETIIVDDGSTDNTGDLIDGYANNNPGRIIAVHQQNRGVSAARNAGIEIAQGKYLCFVDADDEINPLFLTNLIGPAHKNSSDLVIGGYIKIGHGRKSLPVGTFDRHEFQRIIDIRDLGIPFSKLYCSSIIRNHDIRFPENMKLSEDAVFLYRYLQYSDRCTMVDSLDYIYYPPEEDRKYRLGVNDELNGLNAMTAAVIALMDSIPLDQKGIVRLRKRIISSVCRTIVAILALPRRERALWYSKLNWQELLTYISTDVVSHYLLSHQYFKAFDWIRSIRSRLFGQQLSSIFK